MPEARWSSHPATRQDEWVIQTLGRKFGGYCGYFVEVGAFDGYHHSNTLALQDCFRWSGLLVEPNPDHYMRLIRRGGDTKIDRRAVIPAGQIGEFKGTFVMGGQYSGLIDTMPAEFLAEHIRRGNQRITVNMATLDQILADAEAPKRIDYLSLDTEGGEYEILEDWFSRKPDFEINLITVEFRYDKLLMEKITALLEANRYELRDVRGFDLCFKHRDL